jgi:hypothetical protein
VAPHVLTPAIELPVRPLCSAPIIHYADGGAGPLFCLNGAIVVQAWSYYAPIDPNQLALGRNPTVAGVVSAMCADGRLRATRPMLLSGYALAAAYYGWNLNFDPEQFVLYGTCP